MEDLRSLSLLVEMHFDMIDELEGARHGAENEDEGKCIDQMTVEQCQLRIGLQLSSGQSI
ncbi:hypothetical protein WAI453_002280 [Rhynchosporium graminicola]